MMEKRAKRLVGKEDREKGLVGGAEEREKGLVGRVEESDKGLVGRMERRAKRLIGRVQKGLVKRKDEKNSRRRRNGLESQGVNTIHNKHQDGAFHSLYIINCIWCLSHVTRGRGPPYCYKGAFPPSWGRIKKPPQVRDESEKSKIIRD